MKNPSEYLAMIREIVDADEKEEATQIYAFDCKGEAKATLDVIDKQMHLLRNVKRGINRDAFDFKNKYRELIRRERPSFLSALLKPKLARAKAKQRQRDLREYSANQQRAYESVLEVAEEMISKLEDVRGNVAERIEDGDFGDRESKDGDKAERARLYLLSKFLKPRAIEDFTESNWSETWDDLLEKPTGETIDQFLRDGLIIPGGLHAKMSNKFRVVDLKRMLRNRGLKVSGRKAELIDRLIQNASADMQRETVDVKVFECSERSQTIAEEYIAEQKARRSSIEDKTFGLLKSGSFTEAANLMARFEARQVFPRGMGIDWDNYNPARDVKILDIIFRCKPGILSALTDEQINGLRPGAGMLHIWGKSHAGKWISDEIEEEIDSSELNFDAEVAARMIWFYATKEYNLRSYKREGFSQVTISSVGNACDACKAIDGKTFAIDDAPELPYPKCTSPMGCRCIITPSFTSFRS